MSTLATKYNYVQFGPIPMCGISKISLSNGSFETIKKQEAAEYIPQDKLRVGSRYTTDLVSNRQDMQVDLKVNLFLDDNKINSFFINAAPQHLKVGVVQCMAENVYESISKDPSPFIIPGSPLPETIKQFTEFKQYKLADIIPKSVNAYIGQNLSNSFRDNIVAERQKIFNKFRNYNSSDSINMFQVPLSFKFNIGEELDGSKINHLSYFVFCFYDIQEIYNKRNINASFLEINDNRRSCLGLVASELVISSGNVVKDTYAYHDSSGNYWMGQVHYHGQNNPGNGRYIGYMGGTLSSMESYISPVKLTKKKYNNCKIIDNRVLSNFKNRNINLKDDTTEQIRDNNIISQRRVDNSSSELEKKKQTFSNIYYTIDKSKTIRFLFHMDFHNALKSSMTFPKLLDNVKKADPDTYENIIDTSKISNIKLFRKQIKNFQRLGSGRGQSFTKKDLTSQEDLIYESKGIDLYNSKPFSAILESQKNSVTDLSQLIEAQLKISAGPNIKTLTGLDFATKDLEDGMYEYRLEIQVEDPSLGILFEIDRKLGNVLNGLNYGAGSSNNPGLIYYHDISLSSKKFYDPNLERFTTHFYEDSYAKQFPVNNAEGESSFIFSKVKSFIDCVSILISDMSVQELTNLYDHLITISSPVTGSPEGISKLVQTVQNFQLKVQNLISSNSKHRKNDDSNKELVDTPNVSSSPGDVRFVSIDHIFDSKLDLSKMRAEKYYDFLSIQKEDLERNNDGLLLVPSSYFIERTKLESSKYFSNTNGDININYKDGTSFTSGDSVALKQYSFLSPARVYLDTKERTLEILNSGKLSQEREKQNDTLNEIINYNFGRVNNNTTVYSRESESSNAEIKEEFLGLSGVVIKSRSQNSDVRGKKDEKIEIFKKSNSSYREIFEDDTNNFDSYEDRNEYSDRSVRLIGDISKIANFNMFKPYNKDSFYNIDEIENKNNIKNNIPKMGEKNFDPKKADIRNQPNHLKALILGASNSAKVRGNSAIRRESDMSLDEVPKNSISDIRNQGYMFFNYKNIQRIQVLRSFEAINGSYSLNSPVWTDIEEIDLNQANNSLLVCRMITYQKPEYGFEKDNSLVLPICNDLFFLDVSSRTYSNNKNTNINISEGSYRKTTNNIGRSSFKKILESNIGEINLSRSLYLETSYNSKRSLPEFTQNNDGIRHEDYLSTAKFKFATVTKRLQSDFGSLTKLEIENKLVNMGFGDAVVRPNKNAEAGRQTKRIYTQNTNGRQQKDARVPFSSNDSAQRTSSMRTGRNTSGRGSSSGGGSTY